MVYELGVVPFHIGYLDNPENPAGLPQKMPFSFVYDANLGLVRQVVSAEVRKTLEKAYKLGVEIGTPLSTDDFGLAYLEDFCEFVDTRLGAGKNILEIGVGRGHLLSLLRSRGHSVTGIEPGAGYSKEWDSLGIEVIQDFFPSEKLTRVFDAVVAYNVLEHLEDPVGFLAQALSRLVPGGLVFLGVPDCREEISGFDASMFIHEHFSYFDRNSLEKVINQAGMDAQVSESGYGRSLYAIASKSADPEPSFQGRVPQGVGLKHGLFLERLENIRGQLRHLYEGKPLGVYCPMRALMFLDESIEYRFFDDDSRLHGKYLPPFDAKIESRDDLLGSPLDEIFIFSRTFGPKIRRTLIEAGFGGNVHLVLV